MKHYLIKFKKPYLFEGQEYTEIDLSGIDNLLAKDFDEIDKINASQGSITPTMADITISYACVVASVATKKPLEFFKNLPAPEAMKVRYWVINFLNVPV